MRKIDNIFDVADILKQGEAQAKAKHWLDVANELAKQKEESDKYDARLVIESWFKTKRRITLQNAIRLVEAFKWRFDNEIVAPIATTEVELQRAVCKSTDKSQRHVKVSRILDNLVNIKVLEIKTESNYLISQCKCYSFNKFIYDKLIQYASDCYSLHSSQIALSNQDLSYHIVYTCGEESKDELKDLAFDESRVKICKRMRLDVTDVPLSRIRDILDKRYPQFVEGRHIAEELNKRLPDEEKIIWQWKLELAKRDGKTYLTKIGFRASSKISNYKEHQNENPHYRGTWRKDYLKKRLGDDYKHFDVNGSIWRLSYNLSHDDMMPNDVDAYEVAHGAKFESKEQRALFKSIAMRLYFGGINQLGVQVENKIRETAEVLGEKYEYSSWRKDVFSDILAEEKFIACQNIGAFYDSEIFLHESCIYLKMFKHAIDRGIDIIQVYDSFYYDSSNSIDFLTLYSQILTQYKIKFSYAFNPITESDLSYHIVYTCGEKRSCRKSKNKPVIDNSDIPDDDSQTQSKVLHRLQEFIDKQFISKYEAELLSKIARENKKFKESKIGWSIEDRLNKANSSKRLGIFYAFYKEYKTAIDSDAEILKSFANLIK